MKRLGLSDKQFKRMAEFVKGQIKDDPKDDKKHETKDDEKDKKKKEAQGEWLPGMLEPEEAEMINSLVSNVSNAIKWDIFLAYAFCVELLQDVNAHSEASEVNELFNSKIKDEAESLI